MCGLFRVRTSLRGEPPFRSGRRVVLLRGAEGLSQKLIARVVDEPSSKTVAYIKYAEDGLARDKVEAEHRILTELEKQSTSLAPFVLNYGSFGNGIALEVSAVEGEMREAKLPVSEIRNQMSEVREYLEQLHVSDELFEIDEHPAVVRLREQLLSYTSDNPKAQSLMPNASQFSQWLAPLRERAWPVVIQHGDFTPWNIIQRTEAGGQKSEDYSPPITDFQITDNGATLLCAIDWEEGVLDGSPHFDFIYFILQSGCLIHGWEPQRTVDYLLPLLESEGLSEKESVSLIKLCALEAYFRFGAESGNPKLQDFRKQVFSYASQ
ncbi:phosphotransferase [Tichowtungia aerotolerans]|uniref:Phosphotransferase n=1 Tax=Tichowtungia aerotolerans TaxID=2697043 RepID=A0A6P1MCA5_9BACT|nr:phosphotransferase [Tichowtungia aerotolerans]QHI70194.1 phosphotransferase [Tichowtungia aerotolerans]